MQKMGNYVGANVGRRLMIGCITLLIGVPIIGCCLVLLFTVLFPALETGSVTGGGNNSLLLIVIAFILIICGMITLPLLILFFMARQRAQRFDAIFKPLGLTGSTYMLIGHQYHGTLAGREVNIYIYRGPTVEFRVKTNINTRMQIMGKGSLPTISAQLFNKNPFSVENPLLEPFSIFSVDENWCRQWLSSPQVPESIHALMKTGADWAIFRHLEVQPGEVLLFLNRSQNIFVNTVDISQGEIYLKNLFSLADQIDNQPEPQIVTEPLQVNTREKRKKMDRFLLYTIVAIVILIPICLISVGVIVYLLTVT